MSSRIIFLLFPILFSFSSVSAKDKYCKATIHKFNGDLINCLLKMPLKESPSKLIIKLNAESDKKSIGTEDVEFLELTTSKSKFVLKLTEYYFEGKKGRTKTEYRAFMVVEKYCQNYQTFLKATEYEIGKDGNLILVRSGYSTRYYFFKRSGEELPFDLTILYLYGEKIKIPEKRRVVFKEYLKEDPDFAELLKTNRSISVEKVNSLLEKICEE